MRSWRPTLSVVVGERGAGKSVFLRRVVTEVGEDKVKAITCPEEGIEGLLAKYQQSMWTGLDQTMTATIQRQDEDIVNMKKQLHLLQNRKPMHRPLGLDGRAGHELPGSRPRRRLCPWKR